MVVLVRRRRLACKLAGSFLVGLALFVDEGDNAALDPGVELLIGDRARYLVYALINELNDLGFVERARHGRPGCGRRWCASDRAGKSFFDQLLHARLIQAIGRS